MQHKFNRWIRSKTGIYTIAGLLVVVLIVAVAGQQLGWWQSLGLSATAGLPKAEYPMPPGGQTCLPTCGEKDFKFLVIPYTGVKSFTGASITAWVAVPGDQDSFTLDIFDGDSGRDNTGAISPVKGNWETGTVELSYTLYADPMKDGTGTKQVGRWLGNTDNMPNNDWFKLVIQNAPDAKGPSGHYFYLLRVEPTAPGTGASVFKLRSNAYLSAGRDFLTNNTMGIIGGAYIPNDLPLVFPDYKGDKNNPGKSLYNGDWSFSFYVPNDQQKLEIWDGDFDRGSSLVAAADTDDPNTVGKPDWAASPAVVDERAGGKGAPADDYSMPVFKISPAVYYELIDPIGSPVYKNDEPSGTEEWEDFVMSTNDADQPDLKVDAIQPGVYNLHVVGLDGNNAAWLRTNYEICDPVAGCGPRVWNEGMCPRTIGYWKNNVDKVLNGKTNGVQESRETIEWGLRNLALASPIYRHGINVAAPVAIADPTPMTLEEAQMILMRDKKNYPVGDRQSMLARALQQNLATWLNLTTGKIGPTTVVSINVPSGIFEGTMWAALQEAQNIILGGGNLERAKDIADMINNRQLTADDSNVADAACAAPDNNKEKIEVPQEYQGVIPPDKQPPKHDKMPKADKPQEPEPVDPGPAPDPNTCGPISNTYGIENPTNNPFYGIKFEYQSGTEVKDSNYDVFKYTLPKDQADAITSMQVEAKAGQDVGTATIEACAFGTDFPCEPVMSENHLFAFSFGGATDNGDGTVTMTFQVQVFSNSGLSHATFGLPEGVVPPTSGNYQSQVCP